MAKNKSAPTRVINSGIYRSLRVLLHFIAFVTLSYAIYYDHTYVVFPVSDKNMHSPFGGKFKYLTFLDAIIQAFYFIISLANDFIGTNEVAPEKVPAIRKFKDYLMSTFAFPLALTVGITFWSLYGIDRELVLPKILDSVFPSWLNHVMHTNIVVFIVLEMFISFRRYPTRRQGLTGLTIFMFLYLIWVHIIKHFAGVWVYPVLDVLQLPQRIVFFVAMIAFTLSLYLLGEFANNVIWAKELKLAQRKIK